MRLFRPSRFQRGLLHCLLLISLLWLLLLTGLKEYWGFWQSPEVYTFLQHRYPEWQREYMRAAYTPWFAFTLVFFGLWIGFLSKELLSGAPSLRGRQLRLLWIAGFCLVLGLVFGVRGTNNLIGWLDKGQVHGTVPLQVRER